MKAIHLITAMLLCPSLAFAQAAMTERSIMSIDLCDTTSQGFLLPDISQMWTTPIQIGGRNSWQFHVDTKSAQATAKSVPTDSIRQIRISRLQVPAEPTVSLRIMQFNIREDKQEEPAYNTFTGVRATAIVQMVNDVKPDIICLQECRKT